jgi:hypothetical protein
MKHWITTQQKGEENEENEENKEKKKCACLMRKKLIILNLAWNHWKCTLKW